MASLHGPVATPQKKKKKRTRPRAVWVVGKNWTQKATTGAARGGNDKSKAWAEVSIEERERGKALKSVDLDEIAETGTQTGRVIK